MSEQDEQPQRPLLRIVRGEPNDAELAALTGVVAGLAATSGGATSAPPQRSAWGSRASMLRRPLTPGPGAWQSATR